MTTPANQASIPNGSPVATPHYLVDANGNPITVSNPLGVNASFSASSIAINDPTTTTNKATVDGSGNLHVAIAGALAAGTNVIGALVANQSVNLAQVGGSNVALGQAAMAASVPVVVASNQSAVPVSGTITANAGTNLNTSALALESGHLANVDTQTARIPVQGQAAMTGSTPVVVASNQSAFPVNIQSGGVAIGLDNTNEVKTSLYVKTSAAGDTALALGRTTKAGSLPVTMASDQDNINVAVNAALPAGSAVIGSTTIQATSGTALAADQSNTELRVSNYVKTSAAGDTALTLGAATIANSLSVGIASDQTVPIKRSSVAAYTLASTTTSGSTQNSGDITVGPYTEISIDINTTAQAGTNPTIQYFWERKGADGIYYALWQSAVLTAATNTLSTSIGAGMAYNQSLGLTGRFRWVIGGSATPTFTHSLNVYGK